jgi:hypothetical protein
MNYKIGGGFLLILISYSISILFFSWGFSKPELERVWEIYHEFKIDKISNLTDSDRFILSKNLIKHSNLKNEFLKEKEIVILNPNIDGLIKNKNSITILRKENNKNIDLIRIKLNDKNLKDLTVSIKGNLGKGSKWEWIENSNLTKDTIDFKLPDIKSTEIIEIDFNKSTDFSIKFFNSFKALSEVK